MYGFFSPDQILRDAGTGRLQFYGVVFAEFGNLLPISEIGQPVHAIGTVLQVHMRRPKFVSWDSKEIRAEFLKQQDRVDEAVFEWFLGRLRERWLAERDDDALFRCAADEIKLWTQENGLTTPFVVDDETGFGEAMKIVARSTGVTGEHPDEWLKFVDAYGMISYALEEHPEVAPDEIREVMRGFFLDFLDQMAA